MTAGDLIEVLRDYDPASIVDVNTPAGEYRVTGIAYALQDDGPNGKWVTLLGDER